MLNGILLGLSNIIKPLNLIALIGGTLLGFLGGATPGISGLMLVVVLLPITYGMQSDVAFVLLTTIYASAVFSGSISAILFRTPGAPEAVATTLDGYPMAQKGKAGEALGYSVMSSAIGGLIGGLILLFGAPLLAEFALEFGSPEYFALAVMGLSVVSSLSGNSVAKGFIGVSFGLLLAVIGIDPITGIERYTFGSSKLMSGIDFIPVLMGLFAISEIIRKFQDKEVKKEVKKVKTKYPGLKDILKIKGTIIKASLLGTFIGVLPGVGATTASLLGYSEAVRSSKHPEKFGTGIPEGIAAPESANNAAANGAMVPLVALGIPGSATTAVILGAFILHGLQPGPLLVKQQPQLIYTIFLGLLLVNIFILLFAKPFISFFAKILNIPYSVMGTVIGSLCTIGTYAVRNSMLDVWVMLIFGVLGYFMEKVKFPTSPIILGIVLGGLAEQELRRSLVLSNGSPAIFFTRPISLVLLLMAVIGILSPFYKKYRDKKKVALEV
ncbi:tripartite tricarboxylate transporter permease [Proteiniborus sp.]|uniref:tripartite tricarboxylate transporter permease n=1 Tax=Proteiniborus sp. TaxID=2079015 RepID=UPI00332828B9